MFVLVHSDFDDHDKQTDRQSFFLQTCCRGLPSGPRFNEKKLRLDRLLRLKRLAPSNCSFAYFSSLSESRAWQHKQKYLICIVKRGGIYNYIKPEPSGNPWARGKSWGQSPKDFPRVQAIFHCISWLESQYRQSHYNPSILPGNQYWRSWFSVYLQ